MSTVTVANSLNGFFDQNWLHTPIEWSNVAIGNQLEWVRFNVKFANTSKIELGDIEATHRIVGTILVTIFTQPGEGESKALTFADEISTLFSNKIIAGVKCRDMAVSSQNLISGMYQVNMHCPFFFDFIR